MQAIERRDARGARAAMRRHLINSLLSACARWPMPPGERDWAGTARSDRQDAIKALDPTASRLRFSFGFKRKFSFPFPAIFFCKTLPDFI